MITSWSDALGNDITARDVWHEYLQSSGANESLSKWIRRMSMELHGEDDPGVDWESLAKELLGDYHRGCREIVHNILEKSRGCLQ